MTQNIFNPILEQKLRKIIRKEIFEKKLTVYLKALSFDASQFRNLSRMDQGTYIEEFINKEIPTIHFAEMDNRGNYIFYEEKENMDRLRKSVKFIDTNTTAAGTAY